ncbi:Diacylglycerol Kinase Kappa [Manis pentadactyla]|nr:Diacylglycerol Kinase Kappa [Manis pentadactyla]
MITELDPTPNPEHDDNHPVDAWLCMFKNFALFRIVVCGGDGSVSWVLSLIDVFGLHERCQLAVIPLGTGNDLAHVLGWGAFWNKNKSPMNILNRVEQASVQILDRWGWDETCEFAFATGKLAVKAIQALSMIDLSRPCKLDVYANEDSYAGVSGSGLNKLANLLDSGHNSEKGHRWSVMIRETPRQTPLLRGQVERDVPRFEEICGIAEIVKMKQKMMILQHHPDHNYNP